MNGIDGPTQEPSESDGVPTTGQDLPTRVDEHIGSFLSRFGQRTSRRGMLAWVGRGVLAATGAAIVSALPANRLIQVAEASHSCSWYELCGLYGRICDCCNGGGLGSCPSGSTAATSWWQKCCKDPLDNTWQRYRYVDCCGGSANCSSCRWCENIVQQPAWCSGYKCTKIVWAGEC